VASPSILDNYPDYEVNIGIEVHVQLNTKTKIFCRTANETAQEPNTNICQICCGYPGVLPVLNKKVVEYAILVGLATNSKISPRSFFSRKHYFYPDLPKNYQITQGNLPICTEGNIEIKLENNSKKIIRLIRIHMEEDAGKSLHSNIANESFIDLNRTGTPLLEIVSYPDISSSHEAKEYLKTLRSIVQYLGICSGNMEEGAFRADTNISVRKKGSTKLGTRCELKNINSFKFIGDAIEYEIERQITILETGQQVIQQTRLWDEKNKKTILMRSKEEAADYRYFNDPDLPVVEVDQNWITNIKNSMPELPNQKFERFIKEGLSPYEADILVNDIELANYYETAHKYNKSKQIINWVLRELLGYIKESKITLLECKVTPEKLAKIVSLLESSKINNHAAKEVFDLVAQTGQDPELIIKEHGLEQIGSIDELETIIKQIINDNQKQVAQLKAGNEKLFGFFVGESMKKTKGKGNPHVIQELLKKHLKY